MLENGPRTIFRSKVAPHFKRARASRRVDFVDTRDCRLGPVIVTVLGGVGFVQSGALIPVY